MTVDRYANIKELDFFELCQKLQMNDEISESDNEGIIINF